MRFKWCVVKSIGILINVNFNYSKKLNVWTGLGDIFII